MFDVIDSERLTDAQSWAASIRAAYAKTVESVIAVGRELIAAKENLPHGAFERMVRTSLPFKERTAQMYMAVARSPRLCDPNIRSVLPNALSSLYVLAGVEDEVFDLMIAQKSISADKTTLDINSAYDFCKRLIQDKREPHKVVDPKRAEVLQYPATGQQQLITLAKSGTTPSQGRIDAEREIALPLGINEPASPGASNQDEQPVEESQAIEGEWIKNTRLNERQLLQHAYTLFERFLAGRRVTDNEVRSWCENYEWCSDSAQR